MFRRIPIALVVSLMVMQPAAPAVWAVDPMPDELAAALRQADLPAGAGIEAADYSTGGYPQACQETAVAADARGSKVTRSIVSLAHAPGWSWDAGVYVYSSSKAAANSYEQVRAAPLRKCRPLAHFDEQEEGYDLVGIKGEVVTVLNAKAGMPRFVVDNFVRGRSAGVDGDPLDRYAYGVYYRAGKTVEELSASTYLPMTVQQMEQTRDLALELAKRAARI